MRLSRPRRCDAAHGRRRQGQPTRVLYTELCPAPLFLKIAGLFSLAVYTLMVSPRKEDTMRASDKAYAALRDDIIEWRLAPGTVLAEVEQSERLGVSRTPLREARGRLTAEGLTTAGGRGVVVTDISLEDIDELFELRQTLEGKAAALAASRGDTATFEQLQRELARAPEMISGGDPALHDYYELVGRLDAAIDAAIS